MIERVGDRRVRHRRPAGPVRPVRRGERRASFQRPRRRSRPGDLAAFGALVATVAGTGRAAAQEPGARDDRPGAVGARTRRDRSVRLRRRVRRQRLGAGPGARRGALRGRVGAMRIARRSRRGRRRFSSRGAGAAASALDRARVTMLTAMKPLKIGISGVRGVVGETFTPELVVGFAQAFGTYLGPGRILVCRDTRPSGPMVSAAVMAGLLATGCDVVDLGICPTPSLQLAVRWLRRRRRHLDHRRPQPRAVERAEVRPARRALPDARARPRNCSTSTTRGGSRRRPGTGCGRGSSRARRSSTTSTCCPPASTWPRARARRLKVAVDCCNGSCSLLAPRWLAALGLRGAGDQRRPVRRRSRTRPEPKPETAVQVRALVKAGRADIGLVHDADGERLGLVDETGRGALRGGDAGARRPTSRCATGVGVGRDQRLHDDGHRPDRGAVRRARSCGRRSGRRTSRRRSWSTAR